MSVNGERILLVDDEDLIVRVCTQALQREGYHVTGVNSGQFALQAFAAEQFAVVVLDLVLPDIDGLTILSAMREADPDVVVILMTGHASLDSAIEAVRRGAYDYLRKPFNASDLARVIARGLHERTLAVQNRQLLQQLDTVNRDLTQKVNQTTDELMAFISLGRRLESAEGPLPVLRDLTQAAAQLTNATTAGLFEITESGCSRCLVADGEAADLLQRWSGVEEELLHRVIATEAVIMQPRLLDDPKLASGPFALLGFESAMAVPLKVGASHIGALVLFDPTAPFTDRQSSLIKVIAAQAAEVMARASLDRRLRENTDGFITLQELLDAGS